jgi:hypothetical protein
MVCSVYIGGCLAGGVLAKPPSTLSKSDPESFCDHLTTILPVERHPFHKEP